MATVRKLERMHRAFGQCPGHTCRECSNLISSTPGERTVKKCRVYGVTHSEASDWVGRWAACGMLNKPYAGQPIIAAVTRRGGKPPEPEESFAGQMTMDDYL